MAELGGPVGPGTGEPEEEPTPDDGLEAEVRPARPWTVFLISVGLGLAALVLVWLAMGIPPCEEPPNSWAPCIGR